MLGLFYSQLIDLEYTLVIIYSFILIQSTLVLFDPFSPPCSYSVHLVSFVPFGLIQSILVHFDIFLFIYIMGKEMWNINLFWLQTKQVSTIYEVVIQGGYLIEGFFFLHLIYGLKVIGLKQTKWCFSEQDQSSQNGPNKTRVNKMD